jgi:hypothetical protein
MQDMKQKIVYTTSMNVNFIFFYLNIEARLKLLLVPSFFACLPHNFAHSRNDPTQNFNNPIKKVI